MAAASPLSITSERLIDDSKKRPFSCVPPDLDDEADWDEEPSLDIIVHDLPENPEPPESIDDPLMEVSSVIINSLTMDEDKLFGDIRIYGGTSSGVVLFHRENTSDEITTFTNDDGKTELLLTGPTESIMMDANCLRVTMAFMGRNNKSYSDYISFSQMNDTKYTIYDKLISATIAHQAFGSITVNYKVYTNSVTARVYVMLLDSINISGDDVLGEIYAYNSEDKLKSCLFYKSKTNGACVSRRNPSSIPLSRSIVALPYHADLILDFNLNDSKTGLSIVKTEASVFKVPGLLSEVEKVRSSLMRIPQHMKIGGKIVVEVTWALCFEPWHKDFLM